MKFTRLKKLNGYRPTHRNKWLFIQNGILSLQELGLLEFYADNVDFDWNRPSSLGLFEIDFEEIAKIFNRSSDSTIRIWHDKLLKLGFIEETEHKRIFKLACFKRYITPGFWRGEAGKYAESEKDQPFEIITQNFGLNLQTIGEKLQKVGKKNTKTASISPPKALGSYKDKSVVKTEEEYQRIWKEDYDCSPDFTPDDMKWIDQNIYEDPLVPS